MPEQSTSPMTARQQVILNLGTVITLILAVLGFGWNALGEIEKRSQEGLDTVNAKTEDLLQSLTAIGTRQESQTEVLRSVASELSLTRAHLTEAVAERSGLQGKIDVLTEKVNLLEKRLERLEMK